MKKEKDCLFCKIIDGELPSHKIYEDENSFAFLDINPVNRGHILLLPKDHSRNIFDIEDKVFKKLAPVIKKLSIAIKKVVIADGINVHINNEPDAGQVIFHTHIHIIPRFKDDGIKMWKGKPYKDGEEKEITDKISNLLKKKI
ncbi:HIT family protein [Patescibacteria group bacterium]